jgi:hypothetical protein
MVDRVITTEDPAVRRSGFWGVANIIYLLMGLLEGLLAFRLLFQLLGANPTSGFVNFIYSITEPFVGPFYGIFPKAATDGAVTTSVFDPATILAMLVYGLVAWLVVRLLGAATGHPVD